MRRAPARMFASHLTLRRRIVHRGDLSASSRSTTVHADDCSLYVRSEQVAPRRPRRRARLNSGAHRFLAHHAPSATDRFSRGFAVLRPSHFALRTAASKSRNPGTYIRRRTAAGPTGQARATRTRPRSVGAFQDFRPAAPDADVSLACCFRAAIALGHRRRESHLVDEPIKPSRSRSPSARPMSSNMRGWSRAPTGRITTRSSSRRRTFSTRSRASSGTRTNRSRTLRAWRSTSSPSWRRATSRSCSRARAATSFWPATVATAKPSTTSPRARALPRARRESLRRRARAH